MQSLLELHDAEETDEADASGNNLYLVRSMVPKSRRFVPASSLLLRLIGNVAWK